MAYAIFQFKKALGSKVDGEVLQDDLVSRQSIVLRDGDSIGKDKEMKFLLIEGSEPALKRAEELVVKAGGEVVKDGADALYKTIKDQEENSASGMGLMFG